MYNYQVKEYKFVVYTLEKGFYINHLVMHRGL